MISNSSVLSSFYGQLAYRIFIGKQEANGFVALLISNTLFNCKSILVPTKKPANFSGRSLKSRNITEDRMFLFNGGLDLAPIDPVGDGVEALYENHTEIAQHLANLLTKFANCNLEPDQQTVTYIDIDPFLGGIEEQLTRHDPEENRFFYHPDHLGSSSFITDTDGEGYQHLQYLPFGETAVSQKLSWWSTPYRFTGKEKDDETGYNYFGARYYDADISVWLSVDPLADKYPSMSAYMYCAGNPVMLVDSDGRKIDLSELMKSDYEAYALIPHV